MQIQPYIEDDKLAEIIGRAIAADFGLKRSKEYPDRYETEAGTFTAIGIARRAHRHIQDAIQTSNRLAQLSKECQAMDTLASGH